jgi:tetratricopeptide (TPR) repeat protein
VQQGAADCSFAVEGVGRDAAVFQRGVDLDVVRAEAGPIHGFEALVDGGAGAFEAFAREQAEQQDAGGWQAVMQFGDDGADTVRGILRGGAAAGADVVGADQDDSEFGVDAGDFAVLEAPEHVAGGVSGEAEVQGVVAGVEAAPDLIDVTEAWARVFEFLNDGVADEDDLGGGGAQVGEDAFVARGPVRFGLGGGLLGIAGSGEQEQQRQQQVTAHEEPSTTVPSAGWRHLEETRDRSQSALREAQMRGDWAGVLALAEAVQQSDPGEIEGYLAAAKALRQLRRREEMRAVVDAGLARFPDHPKLRAMRVSLAVNAGLGALPPAGPGQSPDLVESLQAAVDDALRRADWPELILACAALRAAQPEEPVGYHLGARALRKLRRMRQAERLSREGAERFADNIPMLLERAAVLQRCKQLEAAAACYARVRALRPDMVLGVTRGANALILLGRFDEAEALLEAGLAQFAGDVDLLVQRAIAATRRGAIAVAQARWEAVRAVAPEDRRLRNAMGDMALNAQFGALDDEGGAVSAAVAAAQGGPLDDAAVLKRFESLGGNCEFGLVQRAAGIEPLGLLRFAAIEAEALEAMLLADFDGVGGAAATRVSRNVHQEYMLEDTRYFRTHTFMKFADSDEAVLLEKLRRRSVFLVDKLRAELRKGSKLFLFRPADGVISEAMIARLHAAVRRFGTGALVCVRNGAGGSVERRGDGLYVAGLAAHEAKLNLGLVQSERYAPWMVLCRAVLAAAGEEGGEVSSKPDRRAI